MVERDADVHEGEVQHPEKRPDAGCRDAAPALKDTADRDERQKHAEPAGGAECGIGRMKKEEAGRRSKRHGCDKAGDWLQAALTKQGHELVDDNDEADEIDD